MDNLEYEKWRRRAFAGFEQEHRQAARRSSAAANEKGAQTSEIATQSAPLAKSQTNRQAGRELETDEMQQHEMPAGLMFDMVNGEPAFELHSGVGDWLIPGTAKVMLDESGKVALITWRPAK